MGGGGDAIYRQFVITLSFVALVGLLLTVFAHTFAEGSNLKGDDSLPDLANVFWDYTTTPYEPTDGCAVTNASVVHKVAKGERGGLEFDSADKRVYVVRDNEQYQAHQPNLLIAKTWTQYKDFIGIKRQSSDWVGGRVYRFAIPLETFVKNFDDETNTSQVYFPLSGSNYTILLKLMDNNTNRIWWNNYTVYLGSNFLTNQKINFWTAIKMMYTGSIPNCNYYINKMVQAIVIFSSLFIIFEMGTRIVPW